MTSARSTTAGYKSLVGWLPGDLGIVALFNDDSVQWQDVLLQVL